MCVWGGGGGGHFLRADNATVLVDISNYVMFMHHMAQSPTARHLSLGCFGGTNLNCEGFKMLPSMRLWFGMAGPLLRGERSVTR